MEICVFLKQTNSSNRLFVYFYPPVGSRMYVLHLEICVFLKQTNSSNRHSVHYYPPVGSQMCVVYIGNMYFWNKQIPRTDLSFIISLQSAHKCVLHRKCVFLKQTNSSNRLFVHYYPPVGSQMCVLHWEICVFLKQTNSSNRLFVHCYPPVGSQMSVLHTKYLCFWHKRIPRTDFSFIIPLQSAHTRVFYIGNMCISETNQFIEQTFHSLLHSSRLTNVCVCVFYIRNLCISETNQFLEQTFRSLSPSSRLTNVCFT